MMVVLLMQDKETTKLRRTKLRKSQHFQIALKMDLMDQLRLTALRESNSQFAKEINCQKCNQVRKQHAEY